MMCSFQVLIGKTCEVVEVKYTKKKSPSCTCLRGRHLNSSVANLKISCPLFDLLRKVIQGKKIWGNFRPQGRSTETFFIKPSLGSEIDRKKFDLERNP